MRRLATGERIRAFLDRLGQRASEPATVYLTGGATAVLMGWRDATIDVDLKLVPDRDELLRLLPALKEELEINVELASPDLSTPGRTEQRRCSASELSLALRAESRWPAWVGDRRRDGEGPRHSAGTATRYFRSATSSTTLPVVKIWSAGTATTLSLKGKRCSPG